MARQPEPAGRREGAEDPAHLLVQRAGDRVHSAQRAPQETRAWTLRAVAASVFAALAGLAGWAWKEKEFANGTITEARGFTDHLMFDIFDKLRTIDGTRDVRVQLVRQVGELQGKLSQVGAKEDHSTRFWTAILEGDIARERQQRDTARGKYEQAARIAEALTRDLNWERNLSVSYGKLGELALQADADQRDFAAARGWYQKALTIDRRLAGLDHGNTVLLRDLLVSTMRLGHLEKEDSNDERESLLAARSMYEEARAIADRLAKELPDDAEAQRVAADNLMHLGKVAYALAETFHDEEAARARSMFTQALAIAESRPDRVLHHASLQYDLCTAYGVVAKLQAANGQFDEARIASSRSLAIAQRHAIANPDDAEWQRSHMLGHATLGEIEAAGAGLAGGPPRLRRGLEDRQARSRGPSAGRSLAGRTVQRPDADRADRGAGATIRGGAERVRRGADERDLGRRTPARVRTDRCAGRWRRR